MRIPTALAAAASLFALGACSESPSQVTSPSALTASRGQVVAETWCGPCHGATLQGDRTAAPSLAAARDYELNEFEQLLAAGTTHDGSQSATMAPASTPRTVNLSAEDRRALYAYLTSRSW